MCGAYETAALRCVKVALAHVPLTQGASVFVSWSSVAWLLDDAVQPL